MLIKELSQQAGVSNKTIRYYETKGLLPTVRRAENNYRIYSQNTIGRVRLIKAAQTLGFSLKEIKDILEAYDNHQLPKDDMASLFKERIVEIEKQIASLIALRELLQGLNGLEFMSEMECNEKCACHLLTSIDLTNKPNKHI